tara:strand:+ start:2041 stop:2364 length:324 start_codon:yes stop_codon:yes gene_type:complete
MFVAVYEFEVKEGAGSSFREAWLEVTKAIYEHCGSFGSRLHISDKPNILVGYAQWPDQEAWERDRNITDEDYHRARSEMLDCLVQSKIVYQLEVSDDYLQPILASQC